MAPKLNEMISKLEATGATVTHVKLGLGYMSGAKTQRRPGFLCEHMKDDGRPFNRLGMPASGNDPFGLYAQPIPESMKADVERLGLKLFVCNACLERLKNGGLVNFQN